MKIRLSIKTLFRTAGKTLFTFILIAALTFSLFLQAAEYQATAREFSENIDMYYGTGYVEKQAAILAGYGKLQYPYYIATDPRIDTSDLPDLSGFDYPSLTTAEVEEISSLPYVSTTARRYMTAGRGEYARLIDDYNIWDYTARAIVEGTLVDSTTSPMHSYQPCYLIKDRKVLAGDMDLDIFSDMSMLALQINSPLTPEDVREELMAKFPSEKELTFFSASLFSSGIFQESYVPKCNENDNNYLRSHAGSSFIISHVCFKNYPYREEAQASWKQGARFVYVFRFDHRPTELQGLTTQLYDWLSEHIWPGVWNITDAPENYLELPEYAPLRELMEITESDLNTLDVVYADDMSAIKLAHDGKMALIEGRWLTPEDTASGAKVCMLDETFARTYGLKVGDVLPLELGDKLFEQFYNLGAVASVPERYADNWTDTEFEIVGLYKTAGGAFAAAQTPNWNYSVNTVFVPLSSLPETVDLTDHELAPGEFTFRVDNAWDIAPFLEETAPKIEAMGLTLMFDDSGWMEVYKPYVEAQRVALIRIALLAAVTVMATAFVVYLFISRKRKDYAIMRALGTPKGWSGRALLLPLLVLTVVSVLVGLAVAAVYIGRMGKLAQLPLGLALLCGVAVLLLTLLLALGILHSLGRQSPLALLQGGTRARKAAKPAAQQSDAAQTAVVAPAKTAPQTASQLVTPPPQARRRKPRPLRFVLSYILRHIRRSVVKSLLSILVAALMLAAVAQLGYMRTVYDQLQRDTVVTARFNMSLTMPKLQRLIDDGQATDVYYERHLQAALPNSMQPPAISVVVTNDVARYTGASERINWTAGHGPEDFGEIGKYALVGAEVLEEYNLSLGDTLHLARQKELENYLVEQLGKLHMEHPDMPLSFEAMFESYPEEIGAALDEFCDCFTIIGSVNSGTSAFDSLVFTPGMETTKTYMGDNLLEFVEFRIPDNSRAREMKQRGEEMTGHRSGAFSIDIEKLESVERTAALLETLYPIVIALTLVIGAFLCVLIIMQTVKDAAIMRILGTTKAMTRAMLAVEQILLAMLGLAIGLGVMAAVHRTDFAAIAKQILLFGGAYLTIAAAASAVSAALATKKNLLELLQTKE